MPESVFVFNTYISSIQWNSCQQKWNIHLNSCVQNVSGETFRSHNNYALNPISHPVGFTVNQ